MTRKFVKRSKFFAIFPDPNLLLDFALAKAFTKVNHFSKKWFLINFFK